MGLKNLGEGMPDGGLFTADQFPKGSPEKPLKGQVPARGAIEAKRVKDDSWVTAEGKQVTRYWGRYHQVLVTNYRDFVLVGRDGEGRPAKLETYRLAESEKEFWSNAANPHSATQLKGQGFVEYIMRACLHAASLDKPKDV